MYGIIGKIKELELNKMWVIFAALFVLTIGATAFFVSQKDDDSKIGEKTPVNQIQVLPVGEEENNVVKEASIIITEEYPEAQPLKVEISAVQTIPETHDPIMKWPGQGEVITHYGFTRSETFNDLRFHPGIDIALPPGYEVRSALSGTVVSISSSPLWGYEVVIKHGGQLETRYKGIKPIKEESGFEVGKGDIIGYVMTSPPYEAKMKPHLHFEVYEYGKSVDPMEHL